MKDYKDLEAWKLAMELVESVYHLSIRLPKREMFGLGDQLRRAVVSIPSNIAEGQRRNSINDFVRFINVALGSASEVETQLIIVEKVYKIRVIEEKKKVETLIKMLFKLRSGLKRYKLKTMNQEP